MGDLNGKNNDENEEFLQSVKKRLYTETLRTDVPEYSHETVEALVKIIDVSEGGEAEEDAEEGLERFKDNFKVIAAAKNSGKKKKHPGRCRRLARVSVAVLMLLVAADITSQAVMDKGLFHMIESWKNQLIVVPGETEVEAGAEELEDFQKNETLIFTDVGEFADYFGDEFLVCGWLPEGVELKEIVLSKTEESSNYVWAYANKEKSNFVLIQMCEKVGNDIAGLTGSKLEKGKHIAYGNNIEATICVNNDVCLAGFEYNGWWYIVTIYEHETIMNSILEGMILYE